jgi:DNA-directed DNA polymerase III PolC
MSPDFWSFFAIDDITALHDLIGLATHERKIPCLDYTEALKAPGLIKMAGNRLQLSALPPDAAKSFYVGLSPSTPIGLYREASAAGLTFVATSDNAYPREEDREFYRIGLGRHAGTQTYPMHILSDEEWREAVWFAKDEEKDTALKLRDELLARCNASLRKATLFVPDKPKTLRQMCEEGAVKKGADITNPIYAARLDHELKMIAQKNFEDYFYIIADIVQYAKTRMIVGPARGSSCGSLVCYLLDITAVDPIPFDLVFERFIDVTRSDLPDIDIDFSDKHRDEVFKYVKDKYGTQHVARLGTVTMFQPKSSIVAIGKALRIPNWRLTKLSDSLIIRSSGDSRANMQLEDTIKQTEAGAELLADFPQILKGAALEDHPSTSSQHAAGVCITAEPINRYVAIDNRTGTTMCDKKDAEDFNMLKIDMLGLTQLSIFERTLELIGKPPINGFLEKVPLDDQKTFDLMNKRHFAGIFQFNGIAVQSVAKWITFTNIYDFVCISALARPGPMASGGATSWVKRMTGQQPIEYPHPLLEPYLKNTLGIVAFQEQVLRIGREIGDLTWEEVTELRKAMSKSLGKEYFDRYGDRWKPNAIKKGIPPEVATKVWDDLCAYGSWAFNASHSVAYAHVSYYSAWLKAHYPLEFAAATLDAEPLPHRQILLLRELQDEGITYLPVDPNLSGAKWEVDREKKKLLGPLTLIKGIGPAAMQKIIVSRNPEAKAPLPPALAKRLANAKTEIDSLYPVRDKVEQLGFKMLERTRKQWVPIKQIEMGLKGEITIIGVITLIAPRDQNDPAKVAKRGGRKLTGPTLALNMFVRDDTEEVLCIIDRWDFEKLGKPITETGKAGRSIYAFRGTVPHNFRMVSVTDCKYVGELDLDLKG